jgi:putative phosphoribosyl transferase
VTTPAFHRFARPAGRFRDRKDAGRRLAAQLIEYRDRHPVVVGIPGGGVPVAAEVARALDAPLDVCIVRKLGVPFQPELAMGAIAEGGVRVLNPGVMHLAHVTETELSAVERRQSAELTRRGRLYRDGVSPLDVDGRTVIVVDDGLATGATARAALEAVRRRGAGNVVLAIPVGGRDVIDALANEADEIVFVEAPDNLRAVGAWYDDFSPTSDEEVISLLRLRDEPAAPTATGPSRHRDRDDPPVDAEFLICTGTVQLPARLTVPMNALGIVLFANGSGSSRHSPRNRFLAEQLNRSRVGTLLFDLLAPDEEHDRAAVFDIPLLAGRLEAATNWLHNLPERQSLPLAYFGSGTGAAAALCAAAEEGALMSSIVSCGGRPDLATERLSDVDAPTLLIVGGADEVVLRLNVIAADHLRCEHRLAIVPGISHLYEEPGALEHVAELSVRWFTHQFGHGAT